MCREPTDLSNSSWLILSYIFLLPLCTVTALNCHCSDSIIQEAGGNCWQPANCAWASAHPQEAEKVEHGTADTSLHLLCLASSLLFSLPHLAQDDKRYKEAKGNGNGLKRWCAQEKGWTKGTICFFFFPAWSQQPGMQWPWFPMALVIHFLSAALEFRVTLLAQHFWRLLFPGPWQQLCLGPGPHEQQWRWASVLGTLFCLVFHGRESFSPSLQTFSWADFYLHYQFQEVILESQPMWTLTRHDRASSAPSPCLASVSRMGSPCRLQGSALQSPVSPTVCRPSVFVLFLGLQPAHMLFGQDPIFLVFEESRGKIKLSACMQNTDPHWSTALLTFCFGKFTVSVQHFSFELLLTLVLVGWNSRPQWFHKYSVDVWGPQLSNKREKCFSLCVRTELIWVKKNPRSRQSSYPRKQTP